YGIVERAAATVALRLRLEPLPMAVVDHQSDSTEAAKRMADLGAGAIVTIGGDGTNRVVAKGCGDVPLTPISTGTNNVFPTMVEGTLAGLAAGFVATGIAMNGGDGPRVVERRPVLRVAVDGEPRDIALVDVVTTVQSWVGARAIWDPAQMRHVVLSRIVPAAIGIASLGGILFPNACGGCAGAAIRIGAVNGARRRVVAPLAPGLIVPVPIASADLIEKGYVADLGSEPTTVALDGEREVRIPPPAAPLTVTLDPRGPRVVNIASAVQAGARAGAFDSERLVARVIGRS
ncbi:MAG TPA: NAD(+)/NADH kinase, partial [Thermomicrobiales bacterium]|nr:NAD(+)/NADH kinase [Thermomicrobiales bacterium]